MTKEVDIPIEDKSYNYEDKMKIYEGNSKAWDLLIIILTDIPSGFVRQCDQNSHESRKALIDKYEVSDEKQEILDEVTNRCNKFIINTTSQGPDIWFNELYNLNLKLNNIKAKYEKD